MPYDAAGKAAAKKYVAEVRGRTVCERCGAQPVEWHRVEHEHDSNRRVSALTALGFPIPVIQAEIDACEAFCRSCHMAIDGRAAALVAARPFKKGDRQPPKPCSECGAETNPQWHGRCRRCYDAMRRPKTKTCACGCGASIATGSTWARGHQERRAV